MILDDIIGCLDNLIRGLVYGIYYFYHMSFAGK